MAEKKKVLVLVKRPPFGSEHAGEALRLAVGLTLADNNEITVALVGDGVGLLRELDPSAIAALEVKKHLDALQMLGVKLVAEAESLEAGDIRQSRAQSISHRDLLRLIDEAEVVIPF